MRRTCAYKRSRMRAGARDRRGTVLVAALVCLLVVMGMLASMLQGALRAHRQLHRERDLRQTDLLLKAGADRARYRLANEKDYRGETWTLSADAIADKGEGRVTIKISPVIGQAAQIAQVMAEFPLGGETSIRRSRTFQFMTQPREQE